MKISGFDLDRVRVTPWADWFFVHVNTDDGLRGLGEMTPGSSLKETIDALWRLEAELRGRDPGRIEEIVHQFGRPDLLGKRLNAPVHVLLGGACREEIQLYANINRISRIPEERTPDWFGRNAAAVAAGFDTVKLAPFDGMPSGIDRAADAEAGIDCLRAVREAIGPDKHLMVDCHSHFSERGALDLAAALRDLNLYWFEQPTPEDDLEVCRRV